MSEIETTYVILLDNEKSVWVTGSGLTREQINNIQKVLNHEDALVIEEPFKLNLDQWDTGPNFDGTGAS